MNANKELEELRFIKMLINLQRVDDALNDNETERVEVYLSKKINELKNEQTTEADTSEANLNIPVVGNNEEQVSVCNLHIMCDHYSKNCHFDCKDYEPVQTDC